MPTRTINLAGTYVIASVNATDIVFASPEQVNPNWLYVDLDGAGTTGYAQNISMVTPPVHTSVDLAGDYTVTSVTPTEIHLSSPEGVNAAWGLLGGFPGGGTAPISAFVSSTSGNWIGPFIVEGDDTTLLVANFLASQGLYKNNSSKQTAFPISVQLESTPVDLTDTPIGAAQTFSTTIPGNSSGRDQRAATLVCELTVPGRQSVRARRTTNGDYNYKGTVVDEVKWQDLYGVAGVDASDFGNVTTVHTRTFATEGALSVKERKLNMLATRKVPIRTGGTSFDPPAATTAASDIFVAICLDEFIGRRSLAELDLDAIYGAVNESVEYFGSADAGRFSFTFDDDNTSFEETAAIVASTVYCTAFRQASQIRLSLERATEDSLLLFNHRNKVPGTEKRTFRFGNLSDNDGIELEYVNPKDDTAATFFLPADRSATNPRKIKGQGIRTLAQAYWAAWRAWNKIRYQNAGVEFTALQEAAAVSRNDRVLIADNTRPETQDGEVVDQDGLVLEVSQPVTFVGGVGYTMFIQLPDGTVDAIPVGPLPEPASHSVLIGRATRVALILDDGQYAMPGYQIVRNDSPRPDAFLVSEREAETNFTYTVRAINYSPLYYMNDALVVWIDFERAYLDAGPFSHDGSAVGASAIVTDGTRGKVQQGAAVGDRVNLEAFNAPASYTKAFWAYRNSTNDNGSILSSTTTHERVVLSKIAKPPPLADIPSIDVWHDGTRILRGGWGGGSASWHHVAVTYDADIGELVIYFDGEFNTSHASVAQRTLGPLHAVGYNGDDGLKGKVSDLRLYNRALAPAEVRALYRATKL